MLFGLSHTCTIQVRARKKRVDYTGLSGGAFVVGNTVTGGTSHATGVVSRLLTAGLVLEDLSGVFVVSETISNGTASATSTAVADYETAQGTPDYYWADSQTGVPCRFYTSRKPIALIGPGQYQDLATKVIVPPTVTVTATEHRVKSTSIGFAKTFRITDLYAAHFTHGINHYELTLEEPPKE